MMPLSISFHMLLRSTAYGDRYLCHVQHSNSVMLLLLLLGGGWRAVLVEVFNGAALVGRDGWHVERQRGGGDDPHKYKGRHQFALDWFAHKGRGAVDGSARACVKKAMEEVIGMAMMVVMMMLLLIMIMAISLGGWRRW